MAASYRTSSAFGNATGAALAGAFSASAGDYLAVFAVQYGGSGGPAITDDKGGTWATAGNDNSGNISGGWFIRNKFAAAETTTITATPGGAGASAVEMVVVAVSGMRSTDTTIADGHPCRNHGFAHSVGTPSTPAATWTLTTKTTSLLLAGVSNFANPPTLTVPTGFTQRQNVGQTSGGNQIGAEVASVDSGRTDTSESWSSSATGWIVSHIELDPLVSAGNAMGETIGTGGLGGNSLAVPPSVYPRSRGPQGIPATASLGYVYAFTQRSPMNIIEAKQNTAINVPVFMRDAVSGSGSAGITLTIKTSKNGAAFATITPTVTDRGGGDYWLALTSSHTDTLGPMRIRVSGAGLVENDETVINVIAWDKSDGVRGGLTALPNAAAGANTGLPVVGTQIPNATAGANTGLPVVGTQIPNATAGANNGLPVQGGAIPNATAGAVGGLSTITAIGQGPGGVLKPNSMEDKMVYSTGKLVSSRLRVFATSTALGNATPGNTDNTDGEVERYVSAVTYDGSGNVTSFKWTKQL